MIEQGLMKKGIVAKPVSLDKIGWTECRTDKQIILYLKNYFKTNYAIELSDELAFAIQFFVDDALSADQKDNLKRAECEQK
jgi:hypothetical protein